MVDPHVVEVVLESLLKYPPNDAAESRTASWTPKDLEFQTLARLWAGMGYIYRVHVRKHASQRVVKHVRLPASITSRGDQRKADSYECEANFYQYVVPQLRQDYGIALPETFHVERQEGSAILIVMSYVETIGSSYDLNPSRTKLVLSWLAQFHAATWGERGRQLVQTHSLQPIGTYWHLDTRPDEHANMSNKGWEGRLKKAARAVHQRLQRDECQCLVHGDVKDANLLFCRQKNGNGESVVLCDFQYCGQGTPAQDLAYFFCSSVEDLNEREEEYLVYYVGELSKYLPSTEAAPSLATIRDSLEWAYCDFQRFMAGWGMWGNDLTGRVQTKLRELDGGENLGSEEEYCAAMRNKFC